jgi:hypothetical protein
MNGIKYSFNTFCNIEIVNESKEMIQNNIIELIDEYENNMRELLLYIKKTIENNLYDDLKAIETKIIEF